MPPRRRKGKRRAGLNKTQRRAVTRIAKANISRSLETKTKSTELSQEMSQTVVITDLVDNIIQGDSGSSRDGDEIKINFLGIRSHIYMEATGTDMSQARMIIFRWKEDSTTAPTAEDLLAEPTGATKPLISHITREPARTKKFQILMDRKFNLQPYISTGTTRTGSTGSHRWLVKRWFKLPKITYLPADSEGYNHIFMMVVSDKSTGGSSNPFHNTHVYVTWKE